MKNYINIKYDTHTFNYLAEYNVTEDTKVSTDLINIKCCKSLFTNDIVYLFNTDEVTHFRNKNDWYNVSSLNDLNYLKEVIPSTVLMNTIRVYLPMYSLLIYKKNIKFVLTANTWVNGTKIDLGSFVFNHNDALANSSGPIKNGNNEYHEYIEFDIVDPFSIVYSKDWRAFRDTLSKHSGCYNNNGSLLYITLYAVDEYDNRYIINNDCIGGSTIFNISKKDDLLSLDIKVCNVTDFTTEEIEKYKIQNDFFGIKFSLFMNSEYERVIDYISDTYGISTSEANFSYELVIKNKDSIIVGALIPYGVTYKNDKGVDIKFLHWNNYINTVKKSIYNNKAIKMFFSDWNNFEEGWSLAGSFIVNSLRTDSPYFYNDPNDNDNIEKTVDPVTGAVIETPKFNEELFTVISNEIPITQEIYSLFTNGCSSKIIDINDMEIKNYNIINKKENKIVYIDRPNESKANIIQPVFFKVKDGELLTLHPDVTENICINLDDYKSKVNNFILKIGNNTFNQIGSNNYGILFKVLGNKISKDITEGTYYILNEDLELVTTGKFNCVR